MSDSRFRPKVKTAQIFINIPGSGSFSVESGAGQSEEKRKKLVAVLEATGKAFWKEYGRHFPATPTPKPTPEQSR